MTAYNAVDDVVSVIDALGRETQLTYDPRDQLVQEVEAVGTPAERTSTFAYDPAGNLVSTTTGIGATNPGPKKV